MHDDMIGRAVAAFGSTFSVEIGEADRALRDIETAKFDEPEAFLEVLSSRDAEAVGRYSVESGVAIVSIVGGIGTAGALGARLGMYPSARSVAAAVKAAADDPEVRSIMLDVSSPGGSVSELQEAVAAIRAAAGKKRLEAYVGGSGASAAYWLAAAAQKITASETAMLGSIGVVMAVEHRDCPAPDGSQRHVIVSKNAGMKRPDPTTEDGRSALQKNVDALEAIFVSSVAKSRRMTPQAIRALDGALMIASDAIKAGLADKIGSRDDVLRSLAGGARRQTSAAAAAPTDASNLQGDTMANDNGAGAEPTAESGAAVPTTPAAQPANPAAAAQPQPANPAEVARLCIAAGLADLTPGLIDAKMTIDAVQAEIENVGRMQVVADQAAKIGGLDGKALMADARKRGLSLAAFQGEVLAKIADAQEKDGAIKTHIPSGATAATASAGASGDYGWGAAFGTGKKEA
ncbi:MAG: S49 family peptidase [Pseudomonadota bacterium]